jgi:ADP-heptose:LPS heptosyltransferase
LRTLVIQLGRLGDVIQSTPLLRSLTAAGEQVDLLPVQPNQAAVTDMAGVTTIRTVGEDRKPLDDQIAAGFPQLQIPLEAWRLLDELHLPHYDRVINASHAALGCWLTGEISSGRREGGVINRNGECLYEGGSHAYRVAMLGFRRQNWFNVVDLLRCAGPTQLRNPENLSLYVHVSEGLPFALPPGRKVALNVGANEKHRRWPAAYFARLAEHLSSCGFVPILVGAPSDREACAEVQAAARIALPNFAGKTSIPEMARLLSECDLLVSADTGAVHIAAAVGTTVLGLYGATACFAETAPWGRGHVILQTPLGAPLSELAPDLVLAGVLHCLGPSDRATLRRELRQHGAEGWHTRFLPENADPLGGLWYFPLHESSLGLDDVFTRGLRHCFAKAWCGGRGTLSLDYLRGEIDIEELCGERDFPEMTDALLRNLASFTQVFEQMRQAAQTCHNLADTMDSAASSKITAICSALTDSLEKLLAVTAKGPCAMFAPVVHYLDWRLRMMPALPPAQTFAYCAKEYRAAEVLLQQAGELIHSFPKENAETAELSVT